MSSSAFIFLLLLSLCVYACNARHLRGSPKHAIKLAEKVMADKPPISPATVVQSKSPAAEVQSQPKIPVKVQVEADDATAMPAAGALSAAGKTKERQTSTRAESVEGRRGVASGIQNLAFLHLSLRPTSELEGTGELARVSGFWSSGIHVAITAEEHAVNKGTDVVEGADVDMDYQQPHSKPPIHNESP